MNDVKMLSITNKDVYYIFFLPMLKEVYVSKVQTANMPSESAINAILCNEIHIFLNSFALTLHSLFWQEIWIGVCFVI